MHNKLNEKTTQLAVWLEGAVSEARSRRGEVSVEWVVIAAALVGLIFLAFTILGQGIGDWVTNLIDFISDTIPG